MSRRSRKGYYVNGEFVSAGAGADRDIVDESGDALAPSRTARKKASEHVRHLADLLVAAPKALLFSLSLPEEIDDAIAEARSIKSFGARRRQTQLVAKRMRQLDDEMLDAIRARLAAAGLE
jgi:ribosome-associated protein